MNSCVHLASTPGRGVYANRSRTLCSGQLISSYCTEQRVIANRHATSGRNLGEIISPRALLPLMRWKIPFRQISSRKIKFRFCKPIFLWRTFDRLNTINIFSIVLIDMQFKTVTEKKKRMTRFFCFFFFGSFCKREINKWSCECGTAKKLNKIIIRRI